MSAVTAVFPAVESDPVALAALTSAVSTLNAAVALRQLASTAATDIELADVESTLDAAVADVQAELDALELLVATDAEVAAAVSAVNAVLVAHAANTANPHAVTKAQVGLGSADNTADSAKPVSSLQQAAFDADRARLTSVESSRVRVVDMEDVLDPTKRLTVVMDANGEIDDLIIEDVV